ncbi:ribonuclease H-like domain-containing protein [Tanacetum coccineum]
MGFVASIPMRSCDLSSPKKHSRLNELRSLMLLRKATCLIPHMGNSSFITIHLPPTVLRCPAQHLAGPSVVSQPTISSAGPTTQYGLSGPPGFSAAPICKPIAHRKKEQHIRPTMLRSCISDNDFQEPAWKMYTGASSSPCREHSLCTKLNTTPSPSSCLVTPNYQQNLILIVQFTRDNNVSVDFDAYGFSVKDYQTRRLLLRCDSTGDLYPVTQQPSTTSTFALITLSPTTWHRRLGHPSDDVHCRLDPRHFIPCNKPKLSALCHSCQLG